MIVTYTTSGNITEIVVDFSDENVELVGRTSVVGDQQKAEAYLPFFERDLRRNFAHLFPQPEQTNTMGGVE